MDCGLILGAAFGAFVVCGVVLSARISHRLVTLKLATKAEAIFAPVSVALRHKQTRRLVFESWLILFSIGPIAALLLFMCWALTGK